MELGTVFGIAGASLQSAQWQLLLPLPDFHKGPTEKRSVGRPRSVANPRTNLVERTCYFKFTRSQHAYLLSELRVTTHPTRHDVARIKCTLELLSPAPELLSQVPRQPECTNEQEQPDSLEAGLCSSSSERSSSASESDATVTPPTPAGEGANGRATKKHIISWFRNQRSKARRR